jgi:hypothetical protein
MFVHQPFNTTGPRVARTHSQIGKVVGNNRPTASIDDPNQDRKFCATDPVHDSNHCLFATKLLRQWGFATSTVSYSM